MIREIAENPLAEEERGSLASRKITRFVAVSHARLLSDCRQRVVTRVPVRTIEAVLLGEPRVERGGLIPPGRTEALFCGGWRFPTTLFSDCGDELFFSTSDCDGRWLVAEAKLVKKKGEEKKTLWICGCAGH